MASVEENWHTSGDSDIATLEYCIVLDILPARIGVGV